MSNNRTPLSQTSLQIIKGVGKSIAERLSKIGIDTVQDLLFHLPTKYQDRTRIHPIKSLNMGDHVVVEGTITSLLFPKVGKTRMILSISDGTSGLKIRFFHIHYALKTTLQIGVRIKCFGEIRYGSQGLEMVHPEYQVIQADTMVQTEEVLTPIYATTEGLSQATFRKLTDGALALLKTAAGVDEFLPASILAQFKFPTLTEALLFVHRPTPDSNIDMLLNRKHIAHQRLIFEELITHRLSLLKLKDKIKHFSSLPLLEKHRLESNFLKSLHFTLTAAQRRVITEIKTDLSKPYPMLRLVQGDVGSGKTVVAAIALLQAIENGCQGAILAPTELLSEQHFQNFKTWFEKLNIQVVLLTGQLKVADRRRVLKDIETGSAQIVVGTHALFQKTVTFSHLGLIVIDEQHRFGVEQRARLREKGSFAGNFPHQLIMTATPIPRTLAMSVYADLDYSVIDELPPGRTPIKTTILSNSRREEVLQRIYDACTSGHQAYWVCTLIEESETLQCQAAEKTIEEFTALFPDLKIGLLHGRMKSAEKESTMAAFKGNQIQLLIATTVIEVGVDVPNASLMIIENAERLGLAQLHQLRGRVGRGSITSFCVLLYGGRLSAIAKDRLSVMRETSDGFKIAQRDLELRGPGEVLGTRQTGEISLRVADLLRDSELLPSVHEAADSIAQAYPQIIPSLINRWLKEKIDFGHV